MMTPQEVASSTFPKAALGGYNMAAVDVFLDKLTEDYTTIYKENAALKAKIKVLVDKMEEYHAMEETMRSTLLTAQKMANAMISEAEEKRTALMAGAESDARARMRELEAEVLGEEKRLDAVRAETDRQIAAEKERLAIAQRELGAFINGARALCDRQIELIDRLNELEILPQGFTAAAPASEAAAAEEGIPEVKMPEPVVMEAPVEAQTAVDEETEAAALAEVVEELGGDANTLMENMRSVIDSFAQEGGAPEQQEEEPFEIGFEDADSLFDDDADDEKDIDTKVTVTDNGGDRDDDDRYDNFAGEDQGATRVLNLNDLQFGRNYNKD